MKFGRGSIAERFHRDRDGAAIIEVAVVVPVLLAIGLGVIEFGNLFYKYHLIANGIRDGARYAAGIMGDVCTDTTLQDYAKNIAVTGEQTGGTPRVDGWSVSEVQVTCTATDNSTQAYRGGDTINVVTLTTSYPYNSLGFLGYFGLGSPTLTFSHEERVIGVR